MNPEFLQTQIDDYLLGHGSPEERRAFEQLVREDPTVKRQLADTELAMAAIEFTEDALLKERLQQVEASLASPENNDEQVAATAPPAIEPRVATMKPLRRSRRTLLAYAASLLLLLAAGWFILQQFNEPSPRELAMDHFTPYRNIAYSFERSGGDDSIEAAAYWAYNAGDFAEAERNFVTLPATDIRLFYLGVAKLGQSDFSGSAPLFQQIIEQGAPDFSLRPEATYYLGVAQLGQGQVEQARASLEASAAMPNNDRQAEARALLKQL